MVMLQKIFCFLAQAVEGKVLTVPPKEAPILLVTKAAGSSSQTVITAYTKRLEDHTSKTMDDADLDIDSRAEFLW